MRSPSSRLRWVLMGLAVSFGARCFIGGEFRSDELECDQAAARLGSCCPGFDAHRIDCNYSPPGCGFTSSLYPALTLDESHCIERESCDALQSSGVCARAQEAQQVLVHGDETPDPPHPKACP